MEKSESIHKPGDRVKNRYIIRSLVGEGGQACVYLADDTMGGIRKVIVKVLIFRSSSPRQRKEELHLFSQEANLLRKVSHPQLPQIIDFFQDGENHYIIEEYIEGISLERLIRERESPFSSREVLEFMNRMIEILLILHNSKPPILVRDIKPKNIVVDLQGIPHLIDFTIAREYVPKKRDTIRMGSPGYAPPEQYKGTTDPRSDIYSLGATAYHMLTRFDPARKPFSLPSIKDANPSADEDLIKIIDKCLQMDPEKRYQKAEELEQDIKNLLTILPQKKQKKVMNRVGLIVGILILVIISFFAGFYLYREYQNRRDNREHLYPWGKGDRKYAPLITVNYDGIYSVCIQPPCHSFLPPFKGEGGRVG